MSLALQEKDLTTESKAQRLIDASKSRFWKVKNPTKTNPISGRLLALVSTRMLITIGPSMLASLGPQVTRKQCDTLDCTTASN